jgi:hypothetical protein
MTTILLYLLVQFNISTSSDISTDSKTSTGDTKEYVQNTDGGVGSWGDGDL